MGDAIQAASVFVTALFRWGCWWCGAFTGERAAGLIKRKPGRETAHHAPYFGAAPFILPVASQDGAQWLNDDFGFAIVMGLLLAGYLALRRIER